MTRSIAAPEFHLTAKEIIMSLKIKVAEIKDFKGVTKVTGATLCG